MSEKILYASKSALAKICGIKIHDMSVFLKSIEKSIDSKQKSYQDQDDKTVEYTVYEVVMALRIYEMFLAKQEERDERNAQDAQEAAKAIPDTPPVIDIDEDEIPF